MKRIKRNYDQAFRDKAVQLALTSGKPVSETAEDLGIKPTTLYISGSIDIVQMLIKKVLAPMFTLN
jgi:hypothetical protein